MNSFTKGLGTFQIAVFVLGPRVNEAMTGPFMSSISVFYSSLGILNIYPISFQNQLFGEFVSFVHVSKFGAPDVGLKPFAPEG